MFKINGGLVSTTLKKSIQRNLIVLRLVEYEGEKGKCEIIFNKKPKEVWLSNLKEEKLENLKIDNKKIVIRYTPYQVITIIIKF